MSCAIKYLAFFTFIFYALVPGHYGVIPSSDAWQPMIVIAADENSYDRHGFTDGDNHSFALLLWDWPLFVFIIVFGAASFFIIPTWYYKKILSALTPMFYGADYVIRSSSSINQ
ncbi:hypothetical protein SAMN05192534_110108 [Alteribacillus persepolensis]|uniref:Uncharacterized protein n=1 Tax=Alteribacillus persepolensis TaxID=568899 RepID=A0A1G8EXK2_9BACI|nr:hypothetical protein [Alteribacillus persepolensis]SDH74537.1 hypothetical protein SAMN05192534_110108 [Alteribacillus persepolensis]